MSGDKFITKTIKPPIDFTYVIKVIMKGKAGLSLQVWLNRYGKLLNLMDIMVQSDMHNSMYETLPLSLKQSDTIQIELEGKGLYQIYLEPQGSVPDGSLISYGRLLKNKPEVVLVSGAIL
jgi:hypothetical protein